MRVTRFPAIVRSATRLTAVALLLGACTELTIPAEGDLGDEDLAGVARAVGTTPDKKFCDFEDPDYVPTKACIWNNGWEGHWLNGYDAAHQQGWQKPWRNLWVIGEGQTGLTNSWAVAWSDVFGSNWDSGWNFAANVNVWVTAKGGKTVGLCAHPVTQLGVALNGCDGSSGGSVHPVVQAVCGELGHCCDANAGSWDDACVAKAVEVAARRVPGSHSVLTPGGPLVPSHHVVADHGGVVGGSDTVAPSTGTGGTSGGGGKGTVAGGFGGSSGTLAPATSGTSGGTTAPAGGFAGSASTVGAATGGVSTGGVAAGGAGTIVTGPSTGTVSDGGGTSGGGKGGVAEPIHPTTGEMAPDDGKEELGNGSNACVAAVCKTAGSEYCCESAWDDQCVEQAIQTCSTQYLTRTRLEHDRVLADACIEPRISGFEDCPLDPTTTNGSECCRTAMILDGAFTVTDTEEMADGQGGGLGRIVHWSLFTKIKSLKFGQHKLRATFIPAPCHTLASGTRACEWNEEHKLWLMAGPVVGRLDFQCSGVSGEKPCNCNTPYQEMCADPGHSNVGMRGLLLAAASALITTNGLHEIDIRWAFGQGEAPFVSGLQQVLALLMPREAHWYAEKVASADPTNASYRARASCYSKFSPQRADQDMVRNVLDCPEQQPNPHPEQFVLMDPGHEVYPAIYSFYGQLMLAPE